MKSTAIFPDSHFALWITGLPASGKSTVARHLRFHLQEEGIQPVILESDPLRPILTPQPDYSDAERDYFYSAMVDLGALIFQQDVPVIFDATAHLRRYRKEATRRISPFFEIFVDAPLEVCRRRDPKGLYRKAERGEADQVPGIQVEYEPPLKPDLRIDGEREDPQEAAARILDFLRIRLNQEDAPL